MAKFSELLDAFDFVSWGMSNEAYICKRSGAVYSHSELADDEEPLPEDIGDVEKYVAIPGQRDLGLGKRLVFAFTAEAIPDDLGKVQEIFSRSGAYATFKDLVEHRGVLDDWYAYERKSQEQELREWCEAEGIEIED